MRLNLSLTHASRWIHTDLTFSFDDVNQRTKLSLNQSELLRSQKYVDQSDNIPRNPKVLTVAICIVIVNINRWYFSHNIYQKVAIFETISLLVKTWLSGNWKVIGSEVELKPRLQNWCKFYIIHTINLSEKHFHNLQISKSAWNLFVISQICDTFPPGWELSCHLYFPEYPPLFGTPMAQTQL